MGSGDLGAGLVLLRVINGPHQPIASGLPVEDIPVLHISAPPTIRKNLRSKGQILGRREGPEKSLPILEPEFIVNPDCRNQKTGLARSRHGVPKGWERENGVIFNPKPHAFGIHAIILLQIHILKRKAPVRYLPVIGITCGKGPILRPVVGFRYPLQQSASHPRVGFLKKDSSIHDHARLGVHVYFQSVGPYIRHLVIQVDTSFGNQATGKFMKGNLVRGQT